MRDGLNADFGHHDGLQSKKELEDLATEFSSQGAELGVDKQRNTNPPENIKTHRSTNTWESHTPGHWRRPSGRDSADTECHPKAANPYLLLRTWDFYQSQISNTFVSLDHLTHHART
jgi:hypothetical protein